MKFQKRAGVDQGAAKRAANLQKAIANAEAAGRKIPSGVSLVDTRSPTAAERTIAAMLEPLAEKCLAHKLSPTSV